MNRSHSSMSIERAYKRPWLSLTALYCIWKFSILCIAVLSPGVGYDTSTSLMDVTGGASSSEASVTSTKFSSMWWKFVRWDAIYYTALSLRGRTWEQELAFSPGVSEITSFITQLMVDSERAHGSILHVQAGVILSLITHWISVLVLFELIVLVVDPKHGHSRPIPLIAAALHIISPAGIFLIAPYSEATFSCLNMLGYLLYAKSRAKDPSSSVFWTLVAGIVLGSATFIRSNGILSGIPFLLDAISLTLQILSDGATNIQRTGLLLLQLIVTGIAGSCVGLGWAASQWYAYKEYCTRGDEVRPWCHQKLPLAYSFVQSHYWNVGFLRYWTLSNLPLFLLASPVLCVLIYSGWHGAAPFRNNHLPLSAVGKAVLNRMAITQLVLAVLALTNYHVQIITRLSSGYPVWYLWLADKMDDEKMSRLVVRFMVVYALVQAGLFATFLPPA